MGEHGEKFRSLLFEDLSQRDVAVHPLEAKETTVFLAKEAGLYFYWYDASIRMDEFCLIDRRQALEGERPVPPFFFLGGGGRSRDLTEVMADQFLPRPVEQHFHGPVHTGDLPVGRQDQNPITGVLKERAVACLAFLQCFFRSLALGKVTCNDQARQRDEGQG